jgi:hypothetical protein
MRVQAQSKMVARVFFNARDRLLGPKCFSAKRELDVLGCCSNAAPIPTLFRTTLLSLGVLSPALGLFALILAETN